MKRTFSMSRVATAMTLACAFSAVSAQPGVDVISTDQLRMAAQSAAELAYWKAKAQCWADLSTSESSQGDTHGTPVTAAANARRIRQVLQAGALPGADAEQAIYSRKYLPAGDSRYGRPKWRADIQSVDAVLNRYKERNCRTPQLGCLEVAQQSVYENMQETRGARWNHGRPEIDKALALASEAAAHFDSACEPKELASIEVPKIERPLEEITLPADTLFKFDRGDANGMLPGGTEALAALAEKVQGYGSRASGLQIVGHTDRLGQPTYNMSLSRRRAATVAELLKARGATLPIASTGVGSTEPTTGDACKQTRGYQALVECLQPDRRVVVRILSTTPQR